MKRSYLLVVVAVASITLLATVFSILPSYSSPAIAAPDSSHDPFEKLQGAVYAPLSQGNEISCTLTYTTTDSLDNDNACPIDESFDVCDDRAVSLAPSYDGLALVNNTDVAPGEERVVPAHADWFLIGNAEVGDEYTVEASPTRGDNYNLGIVVYGPGGTEVVRDERPANNYDASVFFEIESAGAYYLKVYPIPGTSCSGRTYSLETTVVEPSPVPAIDPDDYEPNDNFEEAMADDPTLPIQVPIFLDLTFHSAGDVDYFRFYTKQDRWYQATTGDLNLVDTRVEIFNRDQTRIAVDDDGAGGLASQVSWQADYDGYYFVVVQNNVQSSGSYDLTLDQISEPATVTPGPSPTPGATPRASADECEPNPNFASACVIPLNVSQTFNFIPAFGEGPDNDYYKVWVKPGLHIRCQTSDLSPGVDPNMILFSGPSWDEAIGGNDDIAPCDFNSSFHYYATYSGWLYVLIGTGDRTPPDILDSDYTLICEKSTTPFSATSTPRPTTTPDSSGKLPTAMPTATPSATPTTTESPLGTPTPGPQALSVRPLTTPTPPSRPVSRFVPISLLVYYDANGDGQAGAGEGITGLSAQAYEVATDELLAQGYTDAQGMLSFTVSAQGPVRLTVPFLGFSHLITYDADAQEEASIQVRVPPHSLPGGTP